MRVQLQSKKRGAHTKHRRFQFSHLRRGGGRGTVARLRQRGQRDAEEENWIQWAEEHTVGVARKPDGSPEADQCFPPQPRKGDGDDDERLRGHASYDLEAVHPRHLHVEKHDLRRLFVDDAQRFFAAGGFADDRQVLRRVQKPADPLPRQRLVVNDQRGNRHRR